MCVEICDSSDDQTVEGFCGDGNAAEGVLLWVFYYGCVPV